MKDLSEAQVIEMESRANALTDYLEHDTERLSFKRLRDCYDRAYKLSLVVAQDVQELCEHLRAISIEAQKMENATAKRSGQ